MTTEASIEASNFKPVWDVLKALRAHDEVLADTLDQYRTNMAKNVSQSRESISDKIIFDMPVSVDAGVFISTQDCLGRGKYGVLGVLVWSVGAVQGTRGPFSSAPKI